MSQGFYDQMRGLWNPCFVFSLFTSVTGTLVGAFFGVQVGSAGKAQLEAERKHAEIMAQMALSALPPEQAGLVWQQAEQWLKK